MNDIYGIGQITNPFSWMQPTPAPSPVTVPAQNNNVVRLRPLEAIQDTFVPPVLRPYAPPTPVNYGQPRQPARPELVRPPMAPAVDVDNPIELLRLRLRNVESTDNYQAKNPTTSASGAYQYVNGTWANYGGYPEARLAPKAVQDARAREDIARSMKKFGGDPFRVIANHMLPIQANKPWLWAQPSQLKGKGGKTITIPPVLDYVRKVVKGTPYETQLEQYVASYAPRR